MVTERALNGLLSMRILLIVYISQIPFNLTQLGHITLSNSNTLTYTAVLILFERTILVL